MKFFNLKIIDFVEEKRKREVFPKLYYNDTIQVNVMVVLPRVLYNELIRIAEDNGYNFIQIVNNASGKTVAQFGLFKSLSDDFGSFCGQIVLKATIDSKFKKPEELDAINWF